MLAELQGRNSEVWERLVRGEVKGWQKTTKKGKGHKDKGDKGWTKEADLAFKLTCLYFGLPVAPMGWEQSETKRWWETKKMKEQKRQERQQERAESGGYYYPGYEDDSEDEMMEDEMGNLVMRPKGEDPIKFLNCYGKRVYDKDVIRGELLA